MEKRVVQLEKRWPAQPIGSDAVPLGSVSIRVVVFEGKQQENEPPLGAEDEDIASISIGRGPLDSYLEKTGGKGYVVFLVNGQRHDTLDESFVGSELGFKYLRKRTMITVDVDGLAPEAIAELVQGSRQGFYKGQIYFAIYSRIVAVLEADPDMKQLEAEAEQDIAELKAGDEAVRSKLDALIEGHHSSGPRSATGNVAAADQIGASRGDGTSISPHAVVTQALSTVGERASGPVLTGDPTGGVLRLHPGEKRVLKIAAEPCEAWKTLRSHDFIVTPPIAELSVEVNLAAQQGEVTFLFGEPEAFPEEDYPITGTFTFIASFDGCDEPRVLEREVLVTRKKKRTQRPEPILLPVPTFLRVVSRQPIKLIPGGPATHVRLRWDGQDELITDLPTGWSFRGECSSLLSFPTPLFSAPRRGSFELLLDTPRGLLEGQSLDFQVEAVGPEGESLSTWFRGQVAEPSPQLEARKIERMIHSAGMDRHPPYELKYIDETQWDSGTCWASSNWTKEDAGCLTEPTESMPLTLIINQDAELLKRMREDMMGRKLEEATVKERQARYSAHIAFHLYQMYLYLQSVKGVGKDEPDLRLPTEAELRAEINRVSGTLLRLMDR